MKITDKILVLGANGLVGSAITRSLINRGYEYILTPTSKELDLLNQLTVESYFKENRPDHVFLAAAKVGGIHANNLYRAEFIYNNLQIQNNVFNCCHHYNVDKFLFLGSSCIYPKYAPQPIKEEYLLSGPLEDTNEPYAIAKIAGMKMAESYRRQYGKKFYAVMPTNLYGVGDNFHPENSHVIPGLINRMQETIDLDKKEFMIWGTGTPRREFLYVDDMAEACLFVMETEQEIPYSINIGTGEDIEIKELSKIIAQEMGFTGNFVFNTDMPDGTPCKRLDTSRINSLGWFPKTTLREGIKKTVEYYRSINQK